MTAFDLFLIVGSTAGIVLGLFFSLVLFRKPCQPPYSNQLLALLLFFLALRIGKSVFYNFVELPVWIKNLGLACNLAVGPLLFLYGTSLYQKHYRWKPIEFLHFLPAAGYVIFAGWIPNDGVSLFWKISYSLILLQSFGYVSLAFWLLQNRFDSGTPSAKWYAYLSLGLAAMWLVYWMIFLGAIPIYLAGAFSFTLLVGLIGYLSLDQRSPYAMALVQKYQSSNLDRNRSRSIIQRTRLLLQEERLFLDPGLSLDQLARKVGTTSKTLSQAINENTAHNFTHLINSYRIEHACKLLVDLHYRKEKIIVVALESGFNSLSSFNAVFKKLKNMTPTEFRKSFPNS